MQLKFVQLGRIANFSVRLLSLSHGIDKSLLTADTHVKGLRQLTETESCTYQRYHCQTSHKPTSIEIPLHTTTSNGQVQKKSKK